MKTVKEAMEEIARNCIAKGFVFSYFFTQNRLYLEISIGVKPPYLYSFEYPLWLSGHMMTYFEISSHGLDELEQWYRDCSRWLGRDC
jgi:hypothetical protein